MSENGGGFLKLTGLWKNKTKNGDTYLRGTIGDAQVMIFFDREKRNERAPDARLVLCPRKEREDGGNGGGYGQQRRERPRDSDPWESSGDDDDIPF